MSLYFPFSKDRFGSFATPTKSGGGGKSQGINQKNMTIRNKLTTPAEYFLTPVSPAGADYPPLAAGHYSLPSAKLQTNTYTHTIAKTALIIQKAQLLKKSHPICPNFNKSCLESESSLLPV